jgi:hypothetical protein
MNGKWKINTISYVRAEIFTASSGMWRHVYLLWTDVSEERNAGYSLRKIGMICFAKPGLREDLCIVHKQEFFNNTLYVRYVHLTKSQAYS